MALLRRIGQGVWRRLPEPARATRPLRWLGTIVHRRVLRRAERRQYSGTYFLRNRPQLEQMRRLAAVRDEGTALRVAILGCSIGAEVYSVAWALRTARPDLDLRVNAVDISAPLLAAAERGTYTPESAGLVGASIFERLSEAERQAIFDWDGDVATVKECLRRGIRWYLGDARDRELIVALGPHDVVLASNFLCHMRPASAEGCLRNIAGLVEPGGHLLVLGVDLDVREKVARALRWHPLPDLIREIHEGDPVLRRGWPWEWWGLEPLDERRRDWQLRYAAVYRVG